MSLFKRLIRMDQPPIGFYLDGKAVEGRAGDTVLTAILTNADAVRASDSSKNPRAGFCQMGACQDCWVTLESGERLRACTTPLSEGLRITTGRAA